MFATFMLFVQFELFHEQRCPVEVKLLLMPGILRTTSFSHNYTVTFQLKGWKFVGWDFKVLACEPSHFSSRFKKITSSGTTEIIFTSTFCYLAPLHVERKRHVNVKVTSKVTFLILLLNKVAVQQWWRWEEAASLRSTLICLSESTSIFPPLTTWTLKKKKPPLAQNEAVCHKPVPAGCFHGFHSGRNREGRGLVGGERRKSERVTWQWLWGHVTSLEE